MSRVEELIRGLFRDRYRPDGFGYGLGSGGLPIPATQVLGSNAVGCFSGAGSYFGPGSGAADGGGSSDTGSGNGRGAGWRSWEDA